MRRAPPSLPRGWETEVEALELRYGGAFVSRWTAQAVYSSVWLPGFVEPEVGTFDMIFSISSLISIPTYWL